MTLDEFFEELASYGKIWRRDVRGNDRRIGTTCDGEKHCPISFLAYKHGEKYANLGEANDYGIKIGLSKSDTEDIINAADVPKHVLRARLEALLEPTPNA